jgi:hypothetical protein
LLSNKTLANDNLWKQEIDVAFEEIYNISMLLPPEAAFISSHLQVTPNELLKPTIKPPPDQKFETPPTLSPNTKCLLQATS